MNTESSIIRIGLYGISGAGKTCILTALAMGRQPDPRGYGCISIPLDPAASAAETRAEAIRLGKEWQKEATAALSEGGLPRASEIVDVSKLAPLFEYDFSAPGQQTVRVEMIDYSGELADAKRSDDQLAAALRKHIHEVDALIVVADAPPLGNDNAAHLQGLKRLASALALLRQSQSRKNALKFHLPVALLVSKWDRVGPPSWSHPENDDSKLSVWLTPGDTSAAPAWSIHTQILQYLKSSFEHCAAFPVSAFGAHKTAPSSDTKHPGMRELPTDVEPLRSFNLEAPFLWCARTLAESTIADLEERLRMRLSPWPIHRASAFAKLYSRTPKDGDMGRRLAGFARRSQRRATLLMVGWVGLLIIVALLAQYWVLDRDAIERNTATLRSSESTDRQIADARQRMDKFIHALPMHPVAWILGATDEARSFIASWSIKKDDAFEKEMALTVDVRNRATLAEAYLQTQPNGARAPEARNAIQAWEAEHAIIERKKEQDAVRRRYEAYMEDDQWSEAAQVVLDEPDLPELHADFTAKTPARLTERVNWFIDNRQFDDARKLIRQLEGAPSQIVGAAIDPNRLRMTVDLAEDRDLYQQVQRYRDTRRCDAYLNAKSLPGVMRRYVDAFKKYLASHQQDELSLTFAIRSVKWEKGDHNIGIKLLVNGKILIDQKGIAAETGRTTQPNLSAPFKAKLDDPLEIQIDLADIGWTYDTSYGHLKFNTTASELSGTISHYTEGARKHEITMTVEGIPSEPPLPEFREP